MLLPTVFTDCTLYFDIKGNKAPSLSFNDGRSLIIIILYKGKIFKLDKINTGMDQMKTNVNLISLP